MSENTEATETPGPKTLPPIPPEEECPFFKHSANLGWIFSPYLPVQDATVWLALEFPAADRIYLCRIAACVAIEYWYQEGEKARSGRYVRADAFQAQQRQEFCDDAEIAWREWMKGE